MKENISIFVYNSNKSFSIFFQGSEYFIPFGANLNVSLNRFVRSENTTLEDFLVSNQTSMTNGWSLCTYRSSDDFVKIHRMMGLLESLKGKYKINPEIDWIAYGYGKNETGAVKFQDEYCLYEYGGGVFEVLSHDEKESKVWPEVLSKGDSLRAIIKAMQMFRDDNKDEEIILLATMLLPLKIYNESSHSGFRKYEEFAIIKDTTIPCKRGETFPEEIDSLGELYFGLGNYLFPIPIKKKFGYSPQKLDIALEVDVNSMIFLSFADDSGRVVKLSLLDIINN